MNYFPNFFPFLLQFVLDPVHLAQTPTSGLLSCCGVDPWQPTAEYPHPSHQSLWSQVGQPLPRSGPVTPPSELPVSTDSSLGGTKAAIRHNSAGQAQLQSFPWDLWSNLWDCITAQPSLSLCPVLLLSYKCLSWEHVQYTSCPQGHLKFCFLGNSTQLEHFNVFLDTGWYVIWQF